jgi:hypothetical protein
MGFIHVAGFKATKHFEWSTPNVILYHFGFSVLFEVPIPQLQLRVCLSFDFAIIGSGKTEAYFHRTALPKHNYHARGNKEVGVKNTCVYAIVDVLYQRKDINTTQQAF